MAEATAEKADTKTHPHDKPPRALRVLRPFVGDGCERHYTYDPGLRWNEAAGLAVSLRPVLGDEAANYFAGDPTTQISRAALLWEAHGVGWNIADPDSPDPKNPVVAPITAVNFLRLLPYPAQLWLSDMLFGYGVAPVPGAAGEPETTEQGAAEKN